jgi:CHASE2 domain-containing sensor protein
VPQGKERNVDRRRDVVVLAAAISAGIHAALVPEHLQERTGAGVGFVVATVLLAALAVILTYKPTQVALAAAAAVFAGLVASYVLAITTGLPVLHPEIEPVNGLAVVTKAVEAIGLVTVLTLLQRPPLPSTEPKGT